MQVSQWVWVVGGALVTLLLIAAVAWWTVRECRAQRRPPGSAPP
ncbi:MAG: hypothetical protein AB1716_18050 [Planctomycetota bacterium]